MIPISVSSYSKLLNSQSKGIPKTKVEVRVLDFRIVEDGRLIGTSLVWSSDVDGRLGTGAQLIRSLPFGSPLISLSATDSEGNTTSATIAVFATILCRIMSRCHNTLRE